MIRTSLARATASLLLAAMICLMGSAAASAAPGYRLSSTFGNAGGAGPLTSVGGVSVRAASNDVMVADPSAGVVRRFNRAGALLGTINTSAGVANPALVARDPSTGGVWVGGSDPATGAAKIARYSLSGVPGPVAALANVPGGFTSIGGIATNPNDGRLYVSDSTASHINVFASSGAFTGQFGAAGSDPGQFQSPPGPLTVDGAGNVYVVEPFVRVQKFNGAGVFSSLLTSAMPSAVGADPVNNHVYVVQNPDGGGNRIADYDALGAQQATFGQGQADAITGISVDGATHNVFIGDALGPIVDVYSSFVAPGVVTGASSAVAARSATISGSVDPDGQATDYFFEYGTSPAYDQQTPSSSAGAATTPSDYSAELSDLQPNTTYHYRIVATNQLGRSNGEDQTFTTPAAPPTVSGEAVTNLRATSGVLNANVNANNSPTTAHFDYGLTSSYGTSTDDVDGGSGNFDQPIASVITGLEPDTTYHFRVVADNGVGSPTLGADQTFTTPPLPVSAVPGPASAVSNGSAQLSGTIDTRGRAGTYRFLVSAVNSPFSITTPTEQLSAGSGARPVSAGVTGLPAGGVFEVRIEAVTDQGTFVSDVPSIFSTPASAIVTPRPPDTTAFPYGCAAPRIAAPRGSVTAGGSAVIAGTDLGVNGTVAFGSRQARVQEYSASRIKVTVPTRASGSTPVTVTCGRASNTVRVRVSAVKRPSNRFSLRILRSGSVARVSVRVPGKGLAAVRGRDIVDSTARASRRGVLTLRAKLTRGAVASVRRNGSLKVRIAVRYRPTGGSTRQSIRAVTFKR